MADDSDLQSPDEAAAYRRLRRPVAPTSGHSAKVRDAIRRRGGFASSIRSWWVPLAIAASLLIGFVGGRQSWTDEPERPSGQQYAIVLLNSPSPTWPAGTTEEQIVGEYRDWSVRLARLGRLSVAEELDSARILVDGSGARAGDVSSGLAGLFLISAANDSAAAALASTLPHVRQGGVVAVQRVTTR